MTRTNSDRTLLFSALPALLIAALLALGCNGSPELDSASWDQFHGPGGTGVSPETDLPLYWGEDGAGIRWKSAVPPGVSSPIVSRSQVILTAETVTGKKTNLKVISLSLKNGKPLWETDVFSRSREEIELRSVNNSPAGPTPATDGEHIFAYFGSHLAALDFDGQVVWLRRIDPKYLDEIRYGAGSSVVLTDSSVIVLRDQEETGRAGWLAAFDKKTGERRWRRRWQDTCCSYTTPVLLRRETHTEVIIAVARRIQAFDADSGKRIWHRPQDMNQPVASPVLVDDLLCSATGAHGVKDAACWQLDFAKKPKKMAKRLWRARKGINSIATPVLYNDMLFSITDKGVLYSFDPRTGATHWVARLSPGPYVASLVAGDGKIYAFSRHGGGSVIAASAEYQLLAENQLPEGEILASPAIAGGCLLLRSDAHLLCVEGTAEPVAAKPAA